MTLDEYERQLRAHDWWYAMSDDHRVFTKGDAEQKRLRQLANSDAAYRVLYDMVQKEEMSGCK